MHCDPAPAPSRHTIRDHDSNRLSTINGWRSKTLKEGHSSCEHTSSTNRVRSKILAGVTKACGSSLRSQLKHVDVEGRNSSSNCVALRHHAQDRDAEDAAKSRRRGRQDKHSSRVKSATLRLHRPTIPYLPPRRTHQWVGASLWRSTEDVSATRTTPSTIRNRTSAKHLQLVQHKSHAEKTFHTHGFAVTV